MPGSPADKTKALSKAPAPKIFVSPPAVKQQAVLAATIVMEAATQAQAAVVTAIATYSTTTKPSWAGGFVSPANWAAYDAAITAADTSKASSLALARGLSE